ncbi:NAD(P)-dependent oxidoreductase [Chitinophaga sp. 30R24]|uniref:NAD(P)-dependent oxidoreductase n=1 Tax=Chitinophaga sp. 30R24 TaxID=3248838 RepID=UPI003B90A62D
MRILVTAPYHEQGLLELKLSLGEVIYKPWKLNARAYNEEELMALLYETKAEALITEHDHVTERVIAANTHLQFIGVCRGTPSNVALEAATKLCIPVFYTPARNAQAVAEMFVANVITFMRRTLPAMQWLKDRQWDAGTHTSYLQFKGTELAGKTIGIVGFGAIGQLIARMVEHYPCRIKYYDPYVDAAMFPSFANSSLVEVFSSSDIVSVHLPVTSDTRNIIDKTLFSVMRKDAIFINTARAAVVNREDMYNVLAAGAIRGAILDVFDNEPPDELDYAIIDLPNVMATPHIAGATFEVEDHHVRILNGALIDWFVNGTHPDGKVYNKEVLVNAVKR